MSKIDEFEQKIIKHGMTDEDFLEYGKLLKTSSRQSSKTPTLLYNSHSILR